MSIKIYNAFKYEYKSIDDVARFHKRMIELCQEVYCKEMIEFVGHATMVTAANAVQQKKSAGDILQDYVKNIIGNSSSDIGTDDMIESSNDDNIFIPNDYETDEECIRSFINNIAMKFYMFFLYHGEALSNYNIHPCEVNLSLFYHDNSVLLYTNNEKLNQYLHEMPDISDFHYQDSSDKPDHITLKDWQNRRDMWEEATSTCFSKFHFSNGTNIVVNEKSHLNYVLPMGKHNKAYIDDIILYMQSIFSVIKNQVSSNIVDKYILCNYDISRTKNLFTILNRMKDIRNDINSDFAFTCKQFEDALDESFKCILNTRGKNDDA